jgi:hypothetical protein
MRGSPLAGTVFAHSVNSRIALSRIAMSPVARYIRDIPLSHWPKTPLLSLPHQPPSGFPGAARPAAERKPWSMSASGRLK